MGGFAVYRLPYAKQATLVRQTEGEPLELSSCQALNGHQGFVIAPFEITPDQPILIIRPDETECLDLSRTPSSFLLPPSSKKKDSQFLFHLVG